MHYGKVRVRVRVRVIASGGYKEASAMVIMRTIMRVACKPQTLHPKPYTPTPSGYKKACLW